MLVSTPSDVPLSDVESIYVGPFIVNMSNHAEDSVAALRGLFESTCAKAAWHRPSIVVFDDLDKVIGAELEVRKAHIILFTDGILNGPISTPTHFALASLQHCSSQSFRLATTTLLGSASLSQRLERPHCTHSLRPRIFLVFRFT